MNDHYHIADCENILTDLHLNTLGKLAVKSDHRRSHLLDFLNLNYLLHFPARLHQYAVYIQRLNDREDRTNKQINMSIYYRV